MGYFLRQHMLLISLLLPVLAGAARYREWDRASALFYYSIVISLCTEVAAYFWALVYGHNLIVYNISSLLGIVITCLYFNYTIKVFRTRHLGIGLGAASLGVGAANLVFIQSIHQITHYFLFYQALVVISMSLFALIRFTFIRHPMAFSSQPVFWICCILIFYWTATFCLFTLIRMLPMDNDKPGLQIAVMGLYWVNIFCNLAYTMVFLLVKNKQYAI